MKTRVSRLDALFLDRFALGSLRVLIRARSCRQIWVFDRPGRAGRLAIAICRWLSLLRGDVRVVTAHVGLLRDATGEAEYVTLLRTARTLAVEFVRTLAAADPVVARAAEMWARPKAIFHLERDIEEGLRREILRLALIDWLRIRLGLATDRCAALVARGPAFAVVEDFASRRNLQLLAYRGSTLRAALRLSNRVVREAFRALSASVARLAARTATRGAVPPHAERRGSRPVVAVRWWYRTLSLDPTERSEFFWLPQSGIPYSSVLLYDYVAQGDDKEEVASATRRGIRVLGRGPGVESWQPGLRAVANFVRAGGALTVAAVKSLIRGRRPSGHLFLTLLELAADYAYWLDFFTAHRVAVNVGTMNGTVGQTLALDVLGAASVSYQYSVSNLVAPWAGLSAGEDVHVVFSDVFETLWRASGATADVFLRNGFVYDIAIRAVVDQDRAAKVRKRLEDHGATFILGFFDENSVDRWDVYASHEQAAADYQFLLEWVLADPTLGLVLKPKYSFNLSLRIGRVAELIDRAVALGRCHVMASNFVVGSVFPAEAAYATDVCIGKLSGATAALEARLAGVPSVLIDVEGLRSHPFHAWGRGTVVFESWPELRDTIGRYRHARDESPRFGDWSAALDALDPFRDGQASLRLGSFVRWVWEALGAGVPRDIAVTTAAEKVAERWGPRHVAARQADVPTV